VLLETSVVIQRSAEEVWTYLGNVDNVAQWDRGVAGVEVTSPTAPGVGFEFDTLARSPLTAADKNWGKMSYRITESDPVRGCTVQLTSTTGNARFFKTAEWRFRVVSDPAGSKVFCAAYFKLRFPWQILALLFLSMKRAIHADLESLRQRIEKMPPPESLHSQPEGQ
jgi:hypothetical protein